MNMIFLTENQLHNLVSGKNKSFITRTINKQRKYGNTNIFTASINTQDKSVTIGLGEGYAKFVRDYETGKYTHDYGYITNVNECAAIANELAAVIGLKGETIC